MGHEDLERRLRTERGPREAGYQPVDLPATLDGGSRPPRRVPALVRAGLVTAVAAAAVLTVAVLGGVLSGEPLIGDEVASASPSSAMATATASPSASVSEPSATPMPAIGTCGATDLTLAAEPWGGAAGSRGTSVSVGLAPGAEPCELAQHVSGRIVDGEGAVIVVADAIDGATPLSHAAGSRYAIGVSWSNWCGADPVEPLSLELAVGGDAWTAVPAPGDGAIPVPPCMGDGDSTLSVTEIQPAP
jgi:hypothetical protein